MKKLKLLLLILLVYLYMFMPRFAFFTDFSRLIIYPVIIFYFLLHKQVNQSFIKISVRETIIFSFIITYSFLIDILVRPSGEDAPLFVFRNLGFYLECFVGGYVFFTILKNNIGFKMKIDAFLMYICLIAAIISFILIISPSTNAFVSQFLFSRKEIKFDFRNFGITSDFLFSYSITMGIAITMTMHYAQKNKKLLLFIPFYLVAIFFNARIGVIPILVFVAYTIFIKRNIKNLLINGTLFALILILILNMISSMSEATYIWLLQGYNDTMSFIGGNAESSDLRNFRALVGSMIVIPDNIISLVVGTGQDLFFGHTATQHSDIGYIIQLNYGGIIYSSMLLALVFYMFFRLKKYNISNQWFNYVFIGTILICNWKGYIISTNVAFRLLSILYFYYLYNTNMGVRQNS